MTILIGSIEIEISLFRCKFNNYNFLTSLPDDTPFMSNFKKTQEKEKNETDRNLVFTLESRKQLIKLGSDCNRRRKFRERPAKSKDERGEGCCLLNQARRKRWKIRSNKSPST